jgi:hypothetical protein
MRPAGDEEDRVAVADSEPDQLRHVEDRRKRGVVDPDLVGRPAVAELLGEGVVVAVEQGVVDVEYDGWPACPVIVVPGRGKVGLGPDAGRLLGNRRRPVRAVPVTGLSASRRQRAQRQAGGGDHSAGALVSAASVPRPERVHRAAASGMFS